MRRSVALATVLAVPAVVAGAAPAPAAAPTDAVRAQRAAAHERAGRLGAAMRTLERLRTPTASQAAHAAALEATLQARATAAALLAGRDAEGAKAALDAARATLDPLADRLLVRDLAERAAAAATEARRAVDATARATLAKAAAHERRRQWAEAGSTYATVAGDAALSPALRRQALTAQRRAEARAVDARPGPTAAFFDRVWDTLRAGLEWALVAALAALVLFGVPNLLRRLHRRNVANGRTTVALSELDPGGGDRSLRSYGLSREFQEAVHDVRDATLLDEPVGIDERRDLDGMVAPQLRVSGGSGTLDTVVEADSTLEVAGLKVNPVRLYRLLRSWMSQPGEFELTGTLAHDGGAAWMAVECHRSDAPGEALGRWAARRTGETARAEVIREVAARYAVEHGLSYVTDDWRSYQAYREALAVLNGVRKVEPDGREPLLVDAAGHLTRALVHDPCNLLACLRMAFVLRMLGRNTDAAAQFTTLIELVRVPDALPAHARSYVANHPELHAFALYNRAVTLGKLVPRRTEAIDQLAQLVAKLGGTLPRERRTPELEWPAAEIPEGPERQRYCVLATAAWGSLLAMRLDEPDGADRRRQERLRRRREALLGQLRELGTAIGEDAAAEPGTVQQAQATLANAIARLELRQDRLERAREAAEHAATRLLDVADPCITLAEVAARSNRPHDAVTQLRAALRISPREPRALTAYGRVLLSLGRADDARRQFALLPDDAFARHQLGRIARNEHDLQEAVAQFTVSQQLRATADHRAHDLVRAVVALAGVPGASITETQAEEATTAAQRLLKAAEREDHRDDVRKRAADVALLSVATTKLTGPGVRSTARQGEASATLASPPA